MQAEHIFKYADVSTRHVTRQDDLTLGRIAAEQARDEGDFPVRVAAYPGGYFIPLGDGREWLDETREDFKGAGLSAAFVTLLEYCVGKKVSVLRLDADGITVEALEKFDW